MLATAEISILDDRLTVIILELGLSCSITEAKALELKQRPEALISTPFLVFRRYLLAIGGNGRVNFIQTSAHHGPATLPAISSRCSL